MAELKAVLEDGVTQDRRELILVLGMGRSGTSALTQMLALCGAKLPDELLGADADNLHGHFEPLEALALNETFLKLFGLTWFDPTLRLQNDVEMKPAVREQFVTMIGAFLARNVDKSPLVVKDPRTVAMADFWFDAALRGGWTVKVVIPIRHPVEVARSLAARNGLSQDYSFALWLKYTLLAEKVSRHLPRVFVAYSRLLEDWQPEIHRISQALDVPLRSHQTEAIAAFLQNDMRHHSIEDADLIENVWARTVFDHVQAACSGPDVDRAAMDGLRDLYFTGEGMLRRAADEQRRLAPPLVVREKNPPIPPMLHMLLNRFTEEGYVAANPDVRQSVKEGLYASGLEHWLAFGYAEGRAVAVLPSPGRAVPAISES